METGRRASSPLSSPDEDLHFSNPILWSKEQRPFCACHSPHVSPFCAAPVSSHLLNLVNPRFDTSIESISFAAQRFEKLVILEFYSSIVARRSLIIDHYRRISFSFWISSCIFGWNNPSPTSKMVKLEDGSLDYVTSALFLLSSLELFTVRAAYPFHFQQLAYVR